MLFATVQEPKTWKLTTDYGEISVSPDKISGIELIENGARAKFSMTNGDTLSGKWSVGKVRLKRSGARRPSRRSRFGCWERAWWSRRATLAPGASVGGPASWCLRGTSPPRARTTLGFLRDGTTGPAAGSARHCAPVECSTRGVQSVAAPFSPEGIKQWLNRCLGVATVGETFARLSAPEPKRLATRNRRRPGRRATGAGKPSEGDRVVFVGKRRARD